MHNIYVDTIKIIKYLKVLQHVSHISDYRGSIIRELCTVLGKKYMNDSIVSFDIGKVGVMAAYSDRVCSSLNMKALIYNELHTRTTGQNILP